MVTRVSHFVRFMGNVDLPAERTDCWIWTGSTCRGYGRFSVDGQSVIAHRWFYQFLNGPVAADLVIRHHCDNPSCVNPDHLAAGTVSENTIDKFSRGRGADRRGEKHPLVRLTVADVLEIRRRAAMGQSGARISADYPVSEKQIGKIVRRENWRHV